MDAAGWDGDCEFHGGVVVVAVVVGSFRVQLCGMQRKLRQLKSH